MQLAVKNDTSYDTCMNTLEKHKYKFIFQRKLSNVFFCMNYSTSFNSINTDYIDFDKNDVFILQKNCTILQV